MRQTTTVVEELQPVIDALRQALKERLVAVVLFGSRARGDAAESSDWDVLVIAEGLPEKTLERYFAIKPLLPPEWRGRLSLLLRTPSEVSDHLSSLLLDIALDGCILFDPTGFAARWLASLRQTLEQAGLYRERTAAGDVWRQREVPQSEQG